MNACPLSTAGYMTVVELVVQINNVTPYELGDIFPPKSRTLE